MRYVADYYQNRAWNEVRQTVLLARAQRRRVMIVDLGAKYVAQAKKLL